MKNITMFLVESKAKKFTTTLGEFLSWFMGEDDVTKVSVEDMDSVDLLWEFQGDEPKDEIFKDVKDLHKWINDNAKETISIKSFKESGPMNNYIAEFNLPGLKGKSVQLVCLDEPYEAFK